jgi:hypothetical protein
MLEGYTLKTWGHRSHNIWQVSRQNRSFYAVYEFQIGGFIPCLTPCIIGSPPYDADLGRFVGGTLFDEPNGTQRHESELSLGKIPMETI